MRAAPDPRHETRSPGQPTPARCRRLATVCVAERLADAVELLLLVIDLDGAAGDAIQWALGGPSPSYGDTATPAGCPWGVVGSNSAGKAR